MLDRRRKPLVRWHRDTGCTGDVDEVAREEPLEIFVDDEPVSVTMRTPGDDEALAVGFLLGEGLLQTRSQIATVEGGSDGLDCNRVVVRLSPGTTIDVQRLSRHVFASSSCGLCGKTSIAAIRQNLPALDSDVAVPAETLLLLPERLRAAQANFARTGGLHAAGIFDATGAPIVVREDVGRHNAVDKVLGYGLLSGRGPFDRHVLMVSGRTSFEIVQKALAARVPILAAVSAPSSLAIELAQEAGMTLIGFLRGAGMNIYSGAERIPTSPTRPTSPTCQSPPESR